ncbi:MAG: hypothetical protein RLZZ262_308 [Bacteroidota bacterium]|jgi:hypothetical protein
MLYKSIRKGCLMKQPFYFLCTTCLHPFDEQFRFNSKDPSLRSGRQGNPIC